jgi:hypothetical protein
MKAIYRFGSGVRAISPTKKEMDYISQVYGATLDWCEHKDGSYTLYGLFSKASAVVREFSHVKKEVLHVASLI